MHDTWTHNGIHYVGMFASYCRKVKLIANGAVVEEEPVDPLIAVSPMGQVRDEDYELISDASPEVTSFSAEAYVRFFKEIMHDLYKIDVHQWTVCQITVNCNVNKLIARLTEIPNVGCASHKMHLEVRRMIYKHEELLSTIDLVHEVMKSCRRKLMNRAKLRNLCDISPVMNNTTRWSTKFAMLEKFTKIRSSLIATADSEDAELVIDRRVAFKNQVTKFAKQLGEINIVILELQRKGITLSNARLALHELLEGIRMLKSNPESPLYQCQLGSYYIAPDSQITQNSTFESGVVKIQRGEAKTMSDDEKQACKGLLLRQTENGPENDTLEPEEPINMVQRLKERKTNVRLPGARSYMNTDFILGSVAEVECLWCMAKYIFPDHRKRSSPILFEAMLFLKVNCSYWDEQTVKEAMSSVVN